MNTIHITFFVTKSEANNALMFSALDSGSDEIEDSKLKFREMRDRLNQKLKTYEGNEECASCNIIKGNKKSKDKNVDKEVSTNTTLTQVIFVRKKMLHKNRECILVFDNWQIE